MKAIMGIIAVLFIVTSANIVSAAPSHRIKGALASAGYRIVVAAPDGDSAIAESQSFTLKSSDKRGTVALISNEGNASGPVVLAFRDSKRKLHTYSQAVSNGICSQAGTTAITGFKITPRKGKKSGSLNLGEITVDSGNGFAYVSKRFRKGELLKGASSPVSSSCVPSGAGGKLGLASTSSSGHGAAAERIRILGDRDNDGLKDSADPDDDNDGVADQFDLDANGDGILDFYQRDEAGNFVGENDENNDDDDDNDEKNDDKDDDDSGKDIGDDDFFAFIFTNLQVDLKDTLNLHVGSVTQEQIDAFVSSQLNMALGVPGDGSFPIELDCNGLSYCSTGGTGTIANYGGSSVGQAFPDNFDEDGDGKGRIDQVALENPFKDFFLKPNAAASQVKAGNVLTEIITAGKKLVIRPLMLDFVFSTSPAIKSLKLGESNGTTTTISYPVSDGDPGTFGNCFQQNVSDGQKVEFTVYRPQRPGVSAAGEAPFMDMGNLRIVVSVSHNNGSINYCPASAFSTSDGNLVPFTGYPGDTNPNQELGLLDTRGDTPFSNSSENTFTFTLDLQQCTGELTGTTNIDLKLRTPRNDNSGQRICIQRS